MRHFLFFYTLIGYGHIKDVQQIKGFIRLKNSFHKREILSNIHSYHPCTNKLTEYFYAFSLIYILQIDSINKLTICTVVIYIKPAYNILFNRNFL